MRTINRAVAIIKPRQPYLDWTKSLSGPPDNLTLNDLQADCTAILIPEFEDHIQTEAFIATDLFNQELHAWDRDPRSWPTGRDYQTFREWFDVEIHSMVLDVSDEDIIREE